MIDLKSKRITVTGGKGFLGTHLIRKLKEDRDCQNVFIAELPEYDLRKLENIKKMFDEQTESDSEAEGTTEEDCSVTLLKKHIRNHKRALRESEWVKPG
ncbi:MAG: hypothetical protein WCC06_03800 [Candidatus Aminicenantales bacterium]